jgi:hypothetical protein
MGCPKQELRPDYRKYLSEGSLSPDFCFPLQIGREWGNNDRGWHVEPARDGLGSFLPAEYATPFTFLPATSVAVAGWMSGFNRASES